MRAFRARPTDPRRSGQAAVEAIFMLPIFMLIFIGMYELFTVTFAAQNAHIRARELLLHNGAYLPASRIPPLPRGAVKPGTPLFEGGEYIVAAPDIWGVPGAVMGEGGMKGEFAASSEDYGWSGIHGDGVQGGAHVEASLVICSPFGCP